MEWIGQAWDWIFALTADAWASTAAWVAVAVGVGTIVVAGLYAKRQVDEAKRQVAEARTARLAQEDQASRALAEQARLAHETLTEQARLAQLTLDHQADEAQQSRDEQAQPNVVLLMESNPFVWETVELAVKNFGLTPAYDVEMSFSPEPRVSWSELSSERVSALPYPQLIPILAPGQEWRTVWDFGPDRLDLEELEKRHTATVTYKDSRHRPFTTTAILDWTIFESRRRVEVFSIHDLVNRTVEQNVLLGKVVDNLAHFATEHRGIWVYGGDGDQEAAHRAREAERRRQIVEQRREQMRDRGRRGEANPPNEAETAPRSTPESSEIQPGPPSPQAE